MGSLCRLRRFLGVRPIPRGTRCGDRAGPRPTDDPDEWLDIPTTTLAGVEEELEEQVLMCVCPRVAGAWLALLLLRHGQGGRREDRREVREEKSRGSKGGGSPGVGKHNY